MTNAAKLATVHGDTIKVDILDAPPEGGWQP